MTPLSSTLKLTNVSGWDYAGKQKAALDRNTELQEFWKKQIAKEEFELAQRVPGTIRDTKQRLKDAKTELQKAKTLRGCLYNGGVF